MFKCKLYFVLTILVSALLGYIPLAHSSATEGDSKMISAYGLEIRTGTGVSIVVKVNDVPFLSKKAGETGALSIPINGEVVPGENLIEVLIGTAEIEPSAAQESVVADLPESPALSIRLQKDIVTDLSSNIYEPIVEDLDAVSWEPEVEGGKVKLPQSARIHFTAPMDHPVPQWHKAEVRSLSEIQSALINAHRDIIETLRAGDAEAIGQMTALAYQDAAAAYPLGGGAEKRQAEDVDEIRSIISDPEVSIPALLEPLQCRSYAGGRLFECFAADNKAPIRMSFPGEEPIYFKFRFSVIDKKLRIVR